MSGILLGHAEHAVNLGYSQPVENLWGNASVTARPSVPSNGLVIAKVNLHQASRLGIAYP